MPSAINVDVLLSSFQPFQSRKRAPAGKWLNGIRAAIRAAGSVDLGFAAGFFFAAVFVRARDIGGRDSIAPVTLLHTLLPSPP